MSRSLRSEGFNWGIVSFRSCVRAGEAKLRAGVRRCASVSKACGLKISSGFFFCCSFALSNVAQDRIRL